MKYDIFISYRREGGFETANLIANKLKLSGYRVFLDIHSMHSGDYSEQLKERVKECKDFVWVLSPTNLKNDDGTITRIETLSYRDGVDCFRDEICWAIEYHKNIIPVILDGFIIPNEFPKIIQDTINAFNPSCNLHQLQAVEASKNQHFDASISDLKRYLHSHPVIKWAIIALILSFLILFSLLLSSIYHRSSQNKIKETVRTYAEAYEFALNDSLDNHILISARLLDTVFIKTDSVISQTIDYDAYMGQDMSVELGPFYDYFHYIDTCIDGLYSIRPFGVYVSDYYLHDSIVIQNAPYLILGQDDYTNLHYPVLDVSIVNNSGKTILVNELLIDVEKSYIDPNPFVILYELGGELTIEDRGWKSWKKALLRFSLFPEGKQFDGNYLYEVPFSSSEEEIIIPLYDYFVQSGIDFSKLCSSSIVYESEIGKIPYWDNYGEYSSETLDTLKELLFPVKLEVDYLYNIDEDGNETDEIKTIYKDPYLVLRGELTFDNETTFKVGGTVRIITSEGWGAPYLECSRVFDVKLKCEGKNYTVKYPVSHYLKAGDVDRFAIQIDADKTSYHTFRVRLHNVNQIDIKTEPINLLIFKYNSYSYDLD